MKKTLSISRKPARSDLIRDDQRRLGSLAPHLIALLDVKPKSSIELPVARIKSQDTTYNPDQLDIVLIRRNPLPMSNEYDVAISEPNGMSLYQWVRAGVAHLFPEEYRVEAEFHAIELALQESAATNKRADRLRKRYYRQKEDAEVAQYESTATDYDKERLAHIARRTHDEMEVANSIEAFDRFFRLDQLMRDNMIVTLAGRLRVLQYKVLSVWDTVYESQRCKSALPSKAGARLRKAESPFDQSLLAIMGVFAEEECTELSHINLHLSTLAQEFLDLAGTLRPN